MPDPNSENDRTRTAPPLDERLQTESRQRENKTGLWVEAKPGDPPVDVPARIDRFEVRGVLGAGAFGIVYRAFDEKLGRDVAIKVPRTADMSPGEVEEFLRDARAAAAIHHQNVCPVHEIGMEGGQPFIVLHLVVGPTLAKVIEERKTPFPARHAAAIVRKLALGVAAAHARGVTHRDLKPANVLVNSAAWDVLITDFGLAVLTEETRMTATGTAKGTPAYMAPEQARGNTSAIGPHSDIYALGVILYHLLAGTVPFRGSLASVLYRAVHEAPVPPSSHHPGIDAAIEGICLKAMAKNPADRFPSAKALADSLGDYLKGQPVGGGPPITSDDKKSSDADAGKVEESWQEFLKPQRPMDAPHSLDVAVGQLILEPHSANRAGMPARLVRKSRAPDKTRRRIALIGLGAALLCMVVIAIAIGRKHRQPSAPVETATPAQVQPPAPPLVPHDPLPGDTRHVEIAPGVVMVFCWIPAGECQLGAPESERIMTAENIKSAIKKVGPDVRKALLSELDELPGEAEELRGKYVSRGFWMGKYEVSQAEWLAVMNGVVLAGQELGKPSQFRIGGGSAENVRGMNTSRFPVENVNFEECQEFASRCGVHGGIARALGKPGKFALPHADQWEYACRGGLGNGRPFYWGSTLNGAQANCRGTHPYGALVKDRFLERTCTVDNAHGGSYPAHPWGLFHMIGNVAEWCGSDGDPTITFVTCGGSWWHYPFMCRVAHRMKRFKVTRFYTTGCRLVIDLD